MKIGSLFEEKESVFNLKCRNYVYTNTLFSVTKMREAFLNFAVFSKQEYPALAFVKKLDSVFKQEFYSEYSNVNEDIKFDDGAKFISSNRSSYHIYCYDYLGAPPFVLPKIMHSFAIIGNADKLTDIPNWIPEETNDFQIINTGLTNLKDIHKKLKSVNRMAILKNKNFKSHILGVLKIPDFHYAAPDNHGILLNSPNSGDSTSKLNTLEQILNKYLHQDNPNIFECQNELMDAGLEEYAKL